MGGKVGKLVQWNPDSPTTNAGDLLGSDLCLVFRCSLAICKGCLLTPKETFEGHSLLTKFDTPPK